MKRLQLNGSPQETKPMETEKESLIRAIREYIGENGCVAFEHGYTPTFNAQMITDKEVILRFRIGRDRRTKIPLEEFDEGQLKNLIVEMVRYENHCDCEPEQQQNNMSKKKTQEFIVQVTRNENILKMNEKTIEIAVKTWLKEHLSYTSNDITVTIFERK